MALQGREFSSNSYKYGFNGQLKDDEIYGSGNLNTAEFWEYDTRLGRRWETDPVVYPWQSPYGCFNNNPIYYKDPSGQEGGPTNNKIEVPEVPDPIVTPGMPEIPIIGEKTNKTSDKSQIVQNIKRFLKINIELIKGAIDGALYVLDYLTTTGNYGTGHGNNGFKKVYSDKVKRMSMAVADLTEMFGVLKPSNKESIGSSKEYKAPTPSDGKGKTKAEEDKKYFFGTDEDDTNPKASYDDKSVLTIPTNDTVIMSRWQRLKDANKMDTLFQTFDKKDYKSNGFNAKEKKRTWK